MNFAILILLFYFARMRPYFSLFPIWYLVSPKMPFIVELYMIVPAPINSR